MALEFAVNCPDPSGKKLVEAAVAWARGSDRRLLPLCPFARSVFEKTPALRDVLADQ